MDWKLNIFFNQSITFAVIYHTKTLIATPSQKEEFADFLFYIVVNWVKTKANALLKFLKIKTV